MRTRKATARKQNIFGDSTMLDYYSCHLSLDKLVQMTEKQLRLYLYLMHEMAENGERFVLRTALEVFDAIRLDTSDLSKVRRALQSLKLISFKKAHGDKWNYAAVNPAHDGADIRQLSYIAKGKLTPQQIDRYADVRLRRLRPMTSPKSHLSDCPACGDSHTFALRRELSGDPHEYQWECVGTCRRRSMMYQQQKDHGSLIDLEMAIAHRKGQNLNYKQAQYRIERILQNRLLDFDPDAETTIFPRARTIEEIVEKETA